MTHSRIEVTVDVHRCIGAGTCMVVAPTAFGWDQETRHKAQVLDLASVEEERLLEAVLACPTQALVVKRDVEPETLAPET